MAQQFVTIPRDCLPHYDELYSVSDLHLGGPAGFQIFNSGAELAWLIDHARDSQADHVALVINGDFVDFLAEQPSKYFDPEGAAAKLTRITEDEAFAPVFAALREFVRRPQRSLVINLGNHDLELALPWVRQRLLDLLTRDSPDPDAARGRITLSLDGTGFACLVGPSKVVCVHGNEVDTWNLADYEAIRHLAQEVVHGRPVASDWVPNAGTQMVIEVMNEIKHKYPFVDLLKPETSGVLPILGVFEPLKVSQLTAADSILSRLGWDKLRRITGFLGGEADEKEGGRRDAPALLSALPTSDAAARPEAVTPAAGLPLPRGGLSRRANLAQQLLDGAEQELAAGLDPLALVPADQRANQLGYYEAVRNWFEGKDKPEVAREALERLRHDRSFLFDEPDKTFQWLDEQIAGDAEFVLAGHTHLERALPRRKGRGWYYNSGTWARLIRLEERVLASPELFAKVFDALRAGSMKALDDFAEEGYKLVMRRLTVVAVWAEQGRTLAELRRVEAAKGGRLALTAVPESRLPRG